MLCFMYRRHSTFSYFCLPLNCSLRHSNLVTIEVVQHERKTFEMSDFFPETPDHNDASKLF